MIASYLILKNKLTPKNQRQQAIPGHTSESQVSQSCADDEFEKQYVPELDDKKGEMFGSKAN